MGECKLQQALAKAQYYTLSRNWVLVHSAFTEWRSIRSIRTLSESFFASSGNFPELQEMISSKDEHYIAKMVLFFDQAKTSAVTCLCTRALLRYGFIWLIKSIFVHTHVSSTYDTLYLISGFLELWETRGLMWTNYKQDLQYLKATVLRGSCTSGKLKIGTPGKV